MSALSFAAFPNVSYAFMTSSSAKRWVISLAGCTFPDCTTKTIEELRKPKLEAWNRNKENHRAWLALNMVTEARAGFTAFNAGSKDDREVDFVLLRQKIAAGESWVGPMHDAIQPKAKRHA